MDIKVLYFPYYIYIYIYNWLFFIYTVFFFFKKITLTYLSLSLSLSLSGTYVAQIQVIDHSKHHFPNNLTATDRAKQCIAPQANLSDWTRPAEQNIRLQRNEDNSVTIGSNPPLVDNTPRIPASRFDDHTHGDTLPYSPTVLTGCCESWLAYANPGISWSIEDLAERTSQPVSLDGGPSFARMSLSSGQVTLLDYQHYLERKSDDDLAPLYVFDPDILNSKFRNGSYVKNEYDIPDCFARYTRGYFGF